MSNKAKQREADKVDPDPEGREKSKLAALRGSHYKDKFQGLRARYDYVTAKHQTYKRELEVANDKLRKLQAENDLLLDALTVALPSPPLAPPLEGDEQNERAAYLQHQREQLSNVPPEKISNIELIRMIARDGYVPPILPEDHPAFFTPVPKDPNQYEDRPSP